MKQKYRSLFAALLGAAAVTAARAELRAAWEFNAAEVSGANVSASGGPAANGLICLKFLPSSETSSLPWMG